MVDKRSLTVAALIVVLGCSRLGLSAPRSGPRPLGSGCLPAVEPTGAEILEGAHFAANKR